MRSLSMMRGLAAIVATATIIAIACTEHSVTTPRDATFPRASISTPANPPQIDAVTTATDSFVTTLTRPHTTSGINRHLTVVVHHGGEGARVVTSITYSGALLAKVGSVTNGPRVTEIWHLVAPAAGTNNVVVTLNLPARFLLITVISRTGVDQNDPIGAPSSALGTSTTPSVTVASSPGNVIQDALTWDRATLPVASASVGGGRTVLTNSTNSVKLGGATSSGAGGSASPTSWTFPTSRSWGIVGVEIKAVPVVATPDVSPPAIQQLTVTATSSITATITWTTDEPADGQVDYGLDANYGLSTPLDTTRTLTHTAVLTGLVPGTTYHVRVRSSDAASNAATGSDQTVFTPPMQVATTPNILLIMSDNQNERSVAEAMPQVQSLLAANGVTFSDAHVPYPLCCPSRATFLTGQYPHNNNVMSNFPPTGGYGNLNHAETLPVWLQRAGYYTVHIGKYLNGYGTQDTRPNDGLPGCKEVPAGWNEWYGNLGRDEAPVDFVLNENGSLVKYGNPPSYLPAGCDFASTVTGFQTDVYNTKAVNAILQRSHALDGKPFFMTVAYGAPFGPVTAPRHVGAFSTFPLPTPPSFNEADVSDKPLKVRNMPLLNIATVTTAYQRHLASLLAIDEGVRDMVNALAASGQLANTVIIYLSDQGQMFGEHRLNGLVWPYEESLQIPLIISGPGFPAGVRDDHLVSGVDLAPTILELARATSTRPMDGSSLLSIVRNPAAAWRQYSLLEVNAPEVSMNYAGVRDGRYVYLEYGPTWAETELYDLLFDRYQVESKHADPAYAAIKQNLQAQLAALRACAGGACWR